MSPTKIEDRLLDQSMSLILRVVQTLRLGGTLRNNYGLSELPKSPPILIIVNLCYSIKVKMEKEILEDPFIKVHRMRVRVDMFYVRFFGSHSSPARHAPNSQRIIFNEGKFLDS